MNTMTMVPEPVFVGAALPVVRVDGMPAVSDNYGIARTAIRERVKKLVDSLAARR